MNRIEYESHLVLRRVSSLFHSVFFYDFDTVFLYSKGLVAFCNFQGLSHIFKDGFTKFQDNSRTKGTFFIFKEFSRTKVKFQFSRSVRTLWTLVGIDVSQIKVVHIILPYHMSKLPKRQLSKRQL